MFANLIMHCHTASGNKHHLLTKAEREALEAQRKVNVEAAFNSLPKDLSITRSIFNVWICTPECVELLEGADIDASNASQLFDALDADMSGSLTAKEVVEGLLKLRGSITKCDIIAIRMKVRYITELLQAMCKDMSLHRDQIHDAILRKERREEHGLRDNLME